jgi:hypothetical protein
MRLSVLPQLLLAAAPLVPAALSPTMWDVRLQSNGKIDAPPSWKQIGQSDSSQGTSRLYSNPDLTRSRRAGIGPEFKFSDRNLELLTTKTGRLETAIASSRANDLNHNPDDTADDEKSLEEVRVVSYAADNSLQSHTQCWGFDCVTVTPRLCQSLLNVSKAKSFAELEAKRAACTDLVQTFETTLKIPDVAEDTQREFASNTAKINSSHVKDWRAKIRLAIGLGGKKDRYAPADVATLGAHVAWISETVSICSYYADAKAFTTVTAPSAQTPAASNKQEAKP